MNSIREFPPQYLCSRPIIDDKYKVLFKLGIGRFSKVKMALKLDTNERVAVKIMNQKIQHNEQTGMYYSKVLQMFLNEIRMCLQVKHRYIVQVIDFNVGGIYRTADGKIKRILYYVMKIASNGELFRVIKQSETFSEKIARSLFRQILSGVQNMHKHGIAHRDIKPQNILIDESLKIKIADFGYSSYFIGSDYQKIKFNSTDIVGTAKCNAPQLTNSSKQAYYHGDQIDLFACGCLLFEMVMKASPFKTADYKDQFYNRLIKSDTSQYWNIFSANCCPSDQFRDLIEKILNPNPKIRLTIAQIKQHPWYRGQSASLKQYRKDIMNKIKKITVKIRKQQQLQINKFFTQQRNKEGYQFQKVEQITLSREVQQEILRLKQLLHLKQICHSDSGSNADKIEEQEKMIRILDPKGQ